MKVAGIFIFALLFMAGCSFFQLRGPESLPQTAHAQWFRTDAETARPHLSGKIPAHPFFDLVPLLKPQDATVSVYVVTPANSEGDYGSNP